MYMNYCNKAQHFLLPFWASFSKKYQGPRWVRFMKKIEVENLVTLPL